MEKNKLVTLVVIALLVIGGIIIFNRDSDDTQSPDAAQNQESITDSTSGQTAEEGNSENQSENIVTYSDSGFSPSEITVPLGSTVVFVNGSSKQMWVASAPHPTHTEYPEFDQKEGVGAGEKYEFTFTKSGTWRYHDHITPTRFGRIVVE